MEKSTDLKNLNLRIDGEPVAKGRPRMTKTGRVYTPAKTRAYETSVALAARRAKAQPHPTPCSVSIIARYSVPAYKPVWWRWLASKGYIPKTTKPDVDNVCKAVLDGLNGSAYLDDSQVFELTVKKVYSDSPCVEVEVVYHPIMEKTDYQGLQESPQK